MLRIKSKYKIAKRLGAGVFEQTQTQKFALSEARSKKERRGGRGGSDFGRQLLEKQRVRYTYGLSERQLSNYAQEATHEKDPSTQLHRALEMRADSVLYRAGFAPSRRAARQAVSHGHVKVNGTRITSPSHRLKKGDKLEIRESVRTSPLYAGLAEKEDKKVPPQWLSVDPNLLSVEVSGEPQYSQIEAGLDYPTVFEFYSR
ncbi:MAG TPA: 30S ribosomal protein S4 [Candidatus Paceibacterota bacterium]|nr:30S ribosomal protein S4 [Candidatus Paceibacterota bacterium]